MRNAHHALLLCVLCGLASAVAACGYDPSLDQRPFLCGSAEPKCPDGYACMDDGTGKLVCITTSGNLVDAAPSGFQCADDSLLEGGGKNDTIQTAYSTPVASSRKMISFAGVAICPEGDKDTYKVDITTANSNLQVDTEWASGMPVSVSILNGGGTAIAPSTSSGAMSQKAYAANLPVGTYYAQAYAAATTKNNYKITITVTP